MSDDAPALRIQETSDTALSVLFSGNWSRGHTFPDAGIFTEKISNTPRITSIRLYAEQLKNWDSLFVSFLFRLTESCRGSCVELDYSGLPAGVRKLLALAAAVPQHTDTRNNRMPTGLIEYTGRRALYLWKETVEFSAFIGEVWLSVLRWMRGKAYYRKQDFWLVLQQVGVSALPVVGLISVLVGMILAYVGATQLRVFGAEIYIADLVSLGTVREMGAMMTAIIMAGRSGAAFASQLGSMQVNEEIDALRTLGYSTIDFLVLPRILALVLMMPLLTLYADFLGMFGGALVGALELDISFLQYYEQAKSAIGLRDIMAGVLKAGVFGVLIAVSGCLRGIQSGRNASAVGDAATAAVVTGMVLIIIADAVLTVLYETMGV